MQKILVTIIFRSKSEKCEAACGLDWSSAETITVMKQRVKERFAGGVQLKLVDLSGGDAANAKFNNKMQQENLALPLLLVDDEVRISGEFDARQLLDAIEVERELKWKKSMM